MLVLWLFWKVCWYACSKRVVHRHFQIVLPSLDSP